MADNEFEKAAGQFRKVLKLNPAEKEAIGGLASVYRQLGNPAAAEPYEKNLARSGSDIYTGQTRENYLAVYRLLQKRGIRLVCV